MKSRILLIAPLICTLIGASSSPEWTQYLGNAQRTAYSSTSGPDAPEILWKVNTQGIFEEPPIIVGDRVLILWEDNPGGNTSEVKVFSLDLLTGEVKEEFERRAFYFSDIFSVDGRIIGGLGDEIYEIDLVKKKVTLLAKIEERSGNPQKYPLILRSNVSSLAFKSNAPPFFIFYHKAYPIILENSIVFPVLRATCFSTSDFRPVWSLEPQINTYTLVGDEDVVVFLTTDDDLLAVDPSTGAVKWRSEALGAVFWMAIGEDTDTIYCSGDKLWAYSKDGRKLWEFVPEDSIRSNIVVGPDAVFCADTADNVYKIDFNGNLIWKSSYEGSPLFPTHLVGAGDILYCIGSFPDEMVDYDESQITAYSMKDGSMIWRVERGTLGGVSGSPAISQGVLVVGTWDGELVAFASDPELFVKQGDSFLCQELNDKAANAYEKAAALYEKEGNMKKAEEARKRISEPCISPTPTVPPSSSVSPARPQSPSPLSVGELNLVLVSVTVIIAVAFVIYYLIRRRH